MDWILAGDGWVLHFIISRGTVAFAMLDRPFLV